MEVKGKEGNKESEKERRGNSLVARWLGHCALTAEGAGLILKSHRAGGRGSLMGFHYDSVFCIENITQFSNIINKQTTPPDDS